jgi:hypothetical protein
MHEATMSLRLRLRLVLSGLLGALLVVTVGAALQLREIASLTETVLGPAAQVLDATTRMQGLLAEPERGAPFEEAFREQLASIEQVQKTQEEQRAADRLVEEFEMWIAARLSSGAPADESSLRDAVAMLTTLAGEQSSDSVQAVHFEASTTAVGLGVVAAALLVFGVWVSRLARLTLFDRLAAIDHAVAAVRRGETTRRLGLLGDDELGRVAAALDHVLDLRDRAESAMKGRNAELRALLVALSHHWPDPVAVTGIDGEIIASTLSPQQEDILRSISARLREAARTLLSRRFLSAAELATDLRIDAHVIAVRALALGEQRIVGWLAVFDPYRPPTTEPQGTSLGAAET